MMVYIHIPFCISKCIYCDFYSTIDLSLKDEFLKSLEKEIEVRYKNEEITSIYFGGGTPSILNAKEISKILSKFNKKNGCEITIECNPEDITEGKISSYKDAGINRFSIGVQSLNDKELEILKRRHNKEKAIKTLKLLKEKKVNFNCDLIVGIKEQSKKTIKNTLENIISFSPPHLSIYPLEMKKYKYLMENEEKKAELLETAWEFLRKNGYIHYEISNFAKEGYICQHNMGYWMRNEYYGFGPSAHSFLKNIRFRNTNNLEKYIKYSKKNEFIIYKLEKLSEKDIKWERFLLSLRTYIGYTIENLDIERFEELVNDGFLIIKDGKIKLTEKGMLVYNSVILKFINFFFLHKF